jgi:prepilin-type N-terminal cleavage/methylation domain-containing protein
MTRKGFTLIELLVVISIITLLVSIIVPSLGKARILTKRVVCSTRLKGIGHGWLMYLDSGVNGIPMAVSLPSDPTAGPPPAGEVTIMDALSREVDTPEAWHCPGDDQSYFETYGVSYEYYLGLFVPMLQSLQASDPETYEQLVQMRDKWISEYASEITVLYDAASFHPSFADPMGRMCMYYDGHVDVFVEPDSVPAALLEE